MDALRSFKRLENLIYELEGHQQLLNSKVAFFNTMLEALRIPWRLQEINLGRLHAAWHSCSELCHVTWSLLADSIAGPETAAEAFATISEVQQLVRGLIDKGIAWPQIVDPSFAELQVRYLQGAATDDDVRSWFTEHGLWARITHPDGAAEFAGTAIPPRAG